MESIMEGFGGILTALAGPETTKTGMILGYHLDVYLFCQLDPQQEDPMNIVQPESVGLSSERLQRINRVMQQYVDKQIFAGIATLVARRGQIAHLETFGWQDKETIRPMSADTIFRIYSMTKPITSAAVMMLCEEGRLRLVDPVSRHVPEFKDRKVMVQREGGYDLVPAAREVTIHDLLTHTSGLCYPGEEQTPLDDIYRKLFGHMDKGMEPVLEKWVLGFIQADVPLAFHPGTAFRYGISIDLLGYIVQVVSGQPFDEFLKERIFTPLGMVDTDFWVPPEKVGRFAALYGPAKEGGLQVIPSPDGKDYTKPDRSLSGGGGLVSTLGDYVRFGQMLLNRGRIDETDLSPRRRHTGGIVQKRPDAALLGRKTVEWMMQNHLPAGIHPNNEAWNGFGLGGAVLINPGLSPRPGSVGKFGWGGAANTEWWIDPAEELQCLLMLQYIPGFTIPIVEDFAQAVYAALE
jgi:CubicO group peptidase (beta-lactamase class C family)